MVDYLRRGLTYATDKMGDATLYVLDEMKFWGEVITEFMEWDESASDKHLEEVRQRVREQIDESEEYQKEVEQIKA